MNEAEAILLTTFLFALLIFGALFAYRCTVKCHEEVYDRV